MTDMNILYLPNLIIELIAISSLILLYFVKGDEDE